MRIYDPHHVAQIAAMLMSSHGYPEHHHIKKAVKSARHVLDKSFRRADEDQANADAADKAAADAVEASAEKPSESSDGKS